MPNIDDPLPLATAGRYSFPLDAKAILPVVIGDYISSTHVAEDDADGGLLPAVCIDRMNWVYCANDMPSVSGAIRVYANDTPQSSTVYTYNPMVDYEGRGHLISTITFNTDPGSREISWRGKGARLWPSTTLMTNPIDAIAAVFAGYGGWTANDTDWASIMETKRLMNVLGDTINMVFAEQKTYREWLEIILQLYHCDLGLDDAGKLRFMLDTSVTNQPTTILTSLDARRDLAGAEAEPLRIRRDPADIVTQITVSARRKWTNGKYTAEPTVSYAPGVSIHGARHRRYELPGLYSFAQYERWLRGMWLRYGTRADRVTFTTRGLSLMSALPGTFLGMVSPKRHWPSAQLLKVLNCEPNDEDQTITFECFDCQRPADVAATLPTVVMPEVRTRPIQSSPTVDLTPPGPASNFSGLGSYRRIVLSFRVPGDLDYRYTEIWAAQTNNRAVAQNFRTGGVGAVPGSMVQESFDVADGAAWYVWLMTVDISGNGANGGTGPTGGNWWPNSAVGGVNGFLADGTGGVRVQASLINTPGIQPDAIQQLHRQAFGSFGVKLGVNVLAFVTAPIEPQEGYFLFHATATITVPSLCTLALEIHEATQTGPIWGQQVIPNILNSQISYAFVCHGQTYDPSWGSLYGVVAYVLNQAGQHVSFTVSSYPTFTLIHQKR